MSASFRRKGRREEAFGLRGTKAWSGGITLASVGLRDLDAILLGGQPLGTCLLLDEDRWTRDLSLCLTKYWCAEALSQEHHLVIPYFQDSDSNSLPSNRPSSFQNDSTCPQRRGASMSQINALIDSLPRNLHWDKQEKVVHHNVSSTLDVLGEEEEGEEAEEALTIAWQYRKSIQDERLGHVQTHTGTEPTTSADIFCHSFDFNGRLVEQNLNRDCIHLIDGRCSEDHLLRQKQASGFLLFEKLKRHIQGLPKGRLIRLLLYQAPIETASIAIPLLLAYIRSDQIPVVVMVTIQSWTCDSKVALVNLQRACDVVMQTEGFASRVTYPQPAEFQHLHGLLMLPKVSVATAASAIGGGHFADMTMTKRPLAQMYGLKRDRRKLHVTLLHIPPEHHHDERQIPSGGSQSGALLPKVQMGGCGSRGEHSELDF